MIKQKTRISIADIKRAAEGRWIEILVNFGFTRDVLDGQHHPCPLCHGSDRFRYLDPAQGACFCNQCFREQNGDGIAAIVWLNGWSLNETLNAVADYLGLQPKENWAMDVVTDYALRKGIPLEAFRAFGARQAKRGKLTVCRVPMFDADRRQCSHQDFSTISADFLKGMSAKGKPAGLFVATWPAPGMKIFLTEGPKDAAALHSLGYVVVGTCGCKLSEKFIQVFAGCSVYLVHDLDAPGFESSQANAARLYGIANSVWIVRLPGQVKPTNGDGVREVLARAHGEHDLRQAIGNAVRWLPCATTSSDPALEGSEWTSIRADQGRTDQSNSRRFRKRHGDKAKYCHPWSKWLLWNGKQWCMDEGDGALRLAMEVADSVWNDAKTNLTREIVQFAARTSNRSALRSMLELAAADLSVAIDDIDSDPWLLNCPNATVDLRGGTAKPHQSGDYITRMCPTNYVPDARCPNWEQFLYSIFTGDIHLMHFVQRLFGYCLTGVNSEQVLVVMYGTGSNGKSTLLKAIQGVLGPGYCCAAPPSLLMEKSAETHPTEVAGLFGQRLVMAQESSQGARLAESTVKQLTGGDTVTARRMREDFWSFNPTHKLVLATNYKPRIKGTDHAIWRRLVLIPFLQRFWNPAKGESGPVELRQDKNLAGKLCDESEGILAWMIQGCQDWQRNGLMIPDRVLMATESYRSEEDTVGRFISECCQTGPDYKVKFSELYDSLEAWCNESGDNLPSRKGLAQWLKDHDYRDKQSGVRWYLGIGLSVGS